MLLCFIRITSGFYTRIYTEQRATIKPIKNTTKPYIYIFKHYFAFYYRSFYDFT